MFPLLLLILNTAREYIIIDVEVALINRSNTNFRLQNGKVYYFIYAKISGEE